MNWKKKVSKGLNQGFDQSKQFLDKAKKQALSIGEQTLLITEIKELKKKEDHLYQDLGREIYALLVNKGRSSVSLRTAEIKQIFPQLEKLISDLAVKEMMMENGDKK